MTDATDAALIEHISYDDALKARDMVAPIPTHIDVFMAQNGWKQDPVGFGYSRPKHIPTTQPGGDTGCAFKCMTCGADVPDLGPMKTPYYCQACGDVRGVDILQQQQIVERTLEAMYAYELAGSEEGARELLRKASGCERCGLLSHNGMRGSEAHAIMLKAGCVACPVCDEFECTKNHSEFT